MGERPLPLFPATGGDPWALPHPAPTTLLALWPGSRAPLQEQAAEALLHQAPESVLVGEMSSPPDGALWTIVADLPPPIDSRAVLFAEPAVPEGAADLGPDAQACRWLIGLELLLPRERAVRAFTEAMRLAAALAPDTPAILDLAAGTWHTGESLRRWFLGDDADPPLWILWTVHAVCRDRDFPPAAPTWLHTSGLARCGLPELEILDLPARAMRAGTALIQAVAPLLLEEDPIPGPEARWTIGAGLDVALVPWQEVAPLLPDDMPGSLAARGITNADGLAALPGHPLGGVRAVLCDPEPRGTYRRVWHWPEGVVAAIDEGTALLHQSEAVSRRARRVARRTLPRMLELVLPRLASRSESAGQTKDGADGAMTLLVAAAFDARQAGPAPSAVQSPIPRDAPPGDDGDLREHLWLEVDRVHDGRVEGRLVREASMIEGLPASAAVGAALDSICDWQVVLDGVTFTPDDLDELADALAGQAGLE